MPRSNFVRPMPKHGRRCHWTSDKRSRCLSLTEQAWELIGKQANLLAANRSEVIEVVMRYVDDARLDLNEIRETVLEEQDKDDSGSDQCPMPTPNPEPEQCEMTPACSI